MFQPGEEGHHGAQFMLDEGLLDLPPLADGTPSPVTGAFALHIFTSLPAGMVATKAGAVMASADHDGVPLMLSLISLSTSIGGSIGLSVSAAINANVFPQALRSQLPNASATDLSAIYLGGYTTQITYPVGSATRNAINYAWGESQRYGAIASTCILVLAIPAIAVWKNHRVDRKQNKGTMM